MCRREAAEWKIKMDEYKNGAFVPKLTLTPDLGEIPAVTFETKAGGELKEAGKAEIAESGYDSLTEEEKKQVEEFAAKIDITDANMVLQYGAASQKNIADFSGSALEKVKTKDLGEIGDMLGDLIVELKGFSAADERKGLAGLFRRARSRFESIIARYDKAENNVEKISAMLEEHQVTLLKDIAMLDRMYDMNLAYFKELSMYILAGKKKAEEIQTEVIPKLYDKAKETSLPEDAHAANDMSNMLNRFEKKLHDLELTRVVSIQMAPQIRLLQNNDSLMVEKIQSTLVNTIPLWKSQMVLALGLAHSKEAMQAQREVTDMTNELLKKNAEALKTGTLETAKESERSIIDIETLKYTNEQLISTLDEVLMIQKEGAEKRRAAEAELNRIEGELKNKLLELRG